MSAINILNRLVRTTRIHSDARNLLFDCLLHQLGCFYARSLQGRSLRSNYIIWKENMNLKSELGMAILHSSFITVQLHWFPMNNPHPGCNQSKILPCVIIWERAVRALPATKFSSKNYTCLL